MKVGVTVRFQNSYFSGSIPQVACALARAAAAAGHDAHLLYPAGEADWFIDVKEFAAHVPRRVPFAGASAAEKYDTIVEVVWALTPEQRASAADRVIHFAHYPPIFNDTESSVYTWNPSVRNFTNIAAIWTYDFFSKQDCRYLEFLSNKPVIPVPYLWDHTPLDVYVKEESIPEWSDSAKRLEAMIPPDAPQTLSWCGRVVESNFSNTSHCVMPLNIVSEIRKRGEPIRFTVHNGEQVAKHPFFQTNVAKNLLLPDISGNMVPRVRLPDLRKEKTFFVAHQRFRPLKSFLLDAMYLGIPMIHNCEKLRGLGAPYYYELNQILEAVDAWKRMSTDYKAGAGFFAPAAPEKRAVALKAAFSPLEESQHTRIDVALKARPVLAEVPIAKVFDASTLRVAFAFMWEEFQPRYNFFMYLLSWVGKQNGINVVLDETNPQVVFCGPFSEKTADKWAGVPRVYFTGENSPPDKSAFLNIGFRYELDANYIRLPLWILEVNWWGADVNKIVNPRPVAVKDALRVDPAVLDSKQKFCAFVATNPSNGNRNLAFHILNAWSQQSGRGGVDSGGRLFCNLPEGPLPAGLGGAGGELIKVDFYKKYKFALTFENSSSPGYTTEKMFHAKVAGAVPIYWGDPFVDRDFDSEGFINANKISKPEDLINMVQKVADDPVAWRKMAAVPAISEYKRGIVQRAMVGVAAAIFRKILGKDVGVQDADLITFEQLRGIGIGQIA
jgi:hypothetical protein